MATYTYTGFFLKDKLHGAGCLSESTSGYTVTGEWENGRCTKVTGKGVRWACGECRADFDAPATLREHVAAHDPDAPAL